MICAIVLAAGASRRMGIQKLLLPLGGVPVIARVVDAVVSSPVSRVLVVVSSDGDRVREALAGREVEFIVNADTKSDMIESVRCGLRRVPEHCAGILVALGDQPSLTAEVITALVNASDASARSIAVPTFRGRRGHPLLIASRHRKEILQQHDGIGLRGLLVAHPGEVFEVEVTTPTVLDDLDTPEDYARLSERFRIP